MQELGQVQEQGEQGEQGQENDGETNSRSPEAVEGQGCSEVLAASTLLASVPGAGEEEETEEAKVCEELAVWPLEAR